MQLFDPSMRVSIVVVKSDPFSAVGFSELLADNWQTNRCLPLRIDNPAFF